MKICVEKVIVIFIDQNEKIEYIVNVIFSVELVYFLLPNYFSFKWPNTLTMVRLGEFNKPMFMERPEQQDTMEKHGIVEHAIMANSSLIKMFET